MSPYTLDDFAFDLRRAAPPADIWVGSGTGTVAPLPGTVCGVGGWFAPPYAVAGGRLTVEFEVDGAPVADDGQRGAGDRGLLYSGGTWRPDRIVRHGTYHQYRDGRERSIAVRSTLAARHGEPGYVLEIAVRNRTDRSLPVRLRPGLSGDRAREVPLADWGWMPPQAGGDGQPVTLVHNGLSVELEPGAEQVFVLGVQAGQAGTRATAGDTTRAWEARLSDVLARVPRLSTDVPGLDAYYRRSLASGLVCLWDNPAFVTTPFVATSGMDGGAVCGYAWDTGGYAPHLLTLMLGDRVTDVIDAMISADLTNHYAIAPDGTGLGVPYAYSAWSLITLGYAAAGHVGIDSALVKRLYDAQAALDGRFLPCGPDGVLRDYGDQHNLLEMRSAGWEHVVASPNAERAWSLEMLADLSEVSGAGLPAAELRASAGRIRSEVVRQLWDAGAGWFRSRYPDGHTELAYSIQAFDALRAGACPPDVAAALVGHLRPGAFLGDYGVSSVSARDERHYELGDVDWSGGGAYSGEAPQLALTLWERGQPALAWDVLRRLFWMGEHFPYFPQEHYCDRPAAPPVGRRANVVAGLTGAEAVVAGLAGVRPRPDGSLVVRPQPVEGGTVELRGLWFRDRCVDVVCAPDRCLVTVDGQPVAAGPDGAVLAVPPAVRALAPGA
ncbi:MGH1-like glycoside hydrolase domain-containing protein [Rugosimonospora africana]|uniref:Mannosylglycerate hydrolase MGH1-like glycoside hydrolase domain-containing protein n=1 Tax=Rugosimonospora africana TaxID=556532 RepID=A0A8J3VPF9_9ACTN|nr:hypothetical protein [Rugosimonospora africana]GIH14050.1 hypothetical protein Raf01_22220 [Rugosimonospora africana]